MILINRSNNGFWLYLKIGNLVIYEYIREE